MIREQGPLTPTTAAEILRQACAALGAAHKQHIVHRDIKPDNIIVDVTPGGLRVKVLDFGIARMRDIAAANLTQTGSVMGTPHYMSPEQCLGEELDHRSDIYSLGVVLFEMLAGIVPFNSPTSSAVIIQHVNQAPPALRGINISVPPAVENVVLHALSKRREDRPQSAELLAKELSNAVSGNDIPENAHIAGPRRDVPLAVARDGPAPTLQMALPAWNSGAPQAPKVAVHLVSRRQLPWALLAGAAIPIVAVITWFLYSTTKNANLTETVAADSTNVVLAREAAPDVASPASIEPAIRTSGDSPAASSSSTGGSASGRENRPVGSPCEEPAFSCNATNYTFEPNDLSFQLPQSLEWQNAYYSSPFFAILLDSRKALPDPNLDSKCSGFFTEQERLAIQAMFPERKAFASRVGCRHFAVDYTNFNSEYNFVAVYAGLTLQEARGLLRRIRATRRFPDANARLMKAVIRYSGE